MALFSSGFIGNLPSTITSLDQIQGFSYNLDFSDPNSMTKSGALVTNVHALGPQGATLSYSWNNQGPTHTSGTAPYGTRVALKGIASDILTPAYTLTTDVSNYTRPVWGSGGPTGSLGTSTGTTFVVSYIGSTAEGVVYQGGTASNLMQTGVSGEPGYTDFHFQFQGVDLDFDPVSYPSTSAGFPLASMPAKNSVSVLDSFDIPGATYSAYNFWPDFGSTGPDFNIDSADQNSYKFIELYSVALNDRIPKKININGTNSYLCQIVCYNRVLSAQEKTLVWNFLHDRWN